MKRAMGKKAAQYEPLFLYDTCISLSLSIYIYMYIQVHVCCLYAYDIIYMHTLMVKIYVRGSYIYEYYMIYR